MTGMPEAKLAREAELPYAALAMVTDYDAWREGAAPVEVAEILAVMRDNVAHARHALRLLIEGLPAVREASPIDTCLDQALVTPPSERDPRMVERLSVVAGRVLQS
jgi:5'-methylthioadenosine phosphorylase